MRLLLAIAVLLGCAGLVRGQPAALESSAGLRRQFANPPAEYRSMPLFVWNGDVNEADLDKHMAEFKAQGIGGVFVHPRPGLITTYLSDRWFAMFRYTVEKAKQLGMQVWIYDEDSYPSGMAGGLVVTEMPESVNQGQNLSLRKLTALPADGGAACKVLLQKSGEYYCFEVPIPQARGRGYPDLILPGVTEKFLQITMPGYERSVGADFGKTVPGIFSDEPNISPRGGGVRWTPDFFAQFEKRRGYDVRPLLAAMFEDTGDWRRVRHDYYLTLLELFIERWSKPYYAYTEKHGLKWTGHYWEHGWPSPMHGPDNMAMYAWHQQPGIDLLFNQFSEDKGVAEIGEQYGNVRNVKELSSVANQYGRKRSLSETWGGSGWELRFEDMKRLGDWQSVLGVNFMNQHLSYETLAGARKYDWPQSFSYHEPWWKHFHVLADYFARLSLALSTGQQVNRVVILEPTTTAWMYARGSATPDPRLAGVDLAFRPFLNRLEALQAEYDLGCENIIKDQARIEGRRFVIGKRAYDLVVLPPGTETLDSPTVARLAGYLKAGGMVLSFVEAPGRVDGAESSRLRDLARQYPSQWLKAASLDDPVAQERLLSKDFTAVSGKLFHQRRRLADGELLFFVNSSLDVAARADVSLAGRSITRFDALTGETSPFPARIQNGRLAFSVELPPAGSLLLATSNSGAPAAPTPLPAGNERRIEASGPLTVGRVSPNVLKIDYCDLKLGSTVQEDLWFSQAADKAFQQFGFRGDPWSSVQFKSEIVDQDKFPPDSGFEATFHFDVDSSLNAKLLRAVVERPKLWHVSVNGVAVSARPGEWWLDTCFGVYDIGAFVRPGANLITLKAQPMSVHAEIQPVYILGEFGVAAQAKGFRIVPPRELSAGAWKDQLLPFYSDAVAYRRTFQFDRPTGSYRVRLGKWLGSVIEVKVNGSSVGIIAWAPYELDVTKFLRGGRNDVEVLVYGSLRNLLGPHLTKYTPGLVNSRLWRTAPEHTPPGSQYAMLGYGLFEDFQLVASAR